MVPLSELFQNINYVTLKMTNGCNLKCSYCNVEALTPRTPMMSLERFRHIANLLITHSRHDRVGLEFHGGEPLLLSDQWYEEAVTYARALASEHGKEIEFPLVTNGTMLDQRRLDTLHRLGVRLCMSCDGPPEINDILRSGGHAVQRAIELCQRNGVYTGIITVVGQQNFNRMREVMDWYRSIGVHDFRVNFVQPQGRGMDGILLTGEEMFLCMKHVFEHMVETGVAVFEAELGSHIERFIQGRDSRPGLSCWECECQAGRSYVAVDVHGAIHACGTDLKNHVLGHVDEPLDRKAYQEKLRALHDKTEWVLRCFDCDARRICNHSCPTSDFNSDIYKEHECEYTIHLWNFLCEHFDEAKRIYETSIRNGRLQDGSFVPLSELRWFEEVS